MESILPTDELEIWNAFWTDDEIRDWATSLVDPVMTRREVIIDLIFKDKEMKHRRGDISPLDREICEKALKLMESGFIEDANPTGVKDAASTDADITADVLSDDTTGEANLSVCDVFVENGAVDSSGPNGDMLRSGHQDDGDN